MLSQIKNIDILPTMKYVRICLKKIIYRIFIIQLRKSLVTTIDTNGHAHVVAIMKESQCVGSWYATVHDLCIKFIGIQPSSNL